MTLRWLIYTLLALSPLPLASARPSWQWLWVAYIGIIMLVFFVRSFRRRPEPLPKPVFFSVMLACLFTAWGYVQALLPIAPAQLGVPPVDALLLANNSITVDYDKTITNASYFLAHLSFFYLVFLSCARRSSVVQILRFCGLSVGMYAAYGFIVFVSGNDTILWFDKWVSFDSLTGTFVNRNSFAAFLGLGLQCLIAYAYFWTQEELMEGRTGRELYRHILETMLTKAWWLPLAIALTAIALLLTNSRAGFASVAVAVFLLFLLAPNAYQKREKTIGRYVAITAVLAAAIGIFSLSGGLLEQRLRGDASLDQRFKAYPYMIEAIADRPLTGFGLGTFDDVFRIYRDEAIPGWFDRAHSDYLELALTAGIPATLLLVLAVLILVVFLARHLRFGNQYRSFIALGITVSLQLGLHSIVDFSLQMPAVSYMWVAILAASAAVAARCRRVSDAA